MNHALRASTALAMPLGQQIWNDTLAGPSPKKWVNVKALKSGENIAFLVFYCILILILFIYAAFDYIFKCLIIMYCLMGILRVK